jgi:uncharacterized membrane protein HdeD (DUF308 family)
MNAPSIDPPPVRQPERPAADGGLKMPGFLANATGPLLPVAGVAAIAMGVLLLVWPGPSLVVVGTLFGIYLLVTGLFQLTEAFAPHMAGYLRAMGLISGAFSVLLGLICFRGPAESILLLGIWIGFGWLLRGTSTVAIGVSTGRGWLVAVGAITIIGGIVLVASPVGSLVTLTVLAGIWLVALGVMEVVHGVQWYLQARRRR